MRKVDGVIMTASTDNLNETGLHMLATEILTHRKFVKLQ